MNPKRPGEEIIKDNVLHHVFRKLSADAITAEENSTSYSLKVAEVNVKSYTWIYLYIHPDCQWPGGPVSLNMEYYHSESMFLITMCVSNMHRIESVFCL